LRPSPSQTGDGEKLFEVGARDFNFFVVKSGTVEIVEECGETPKTITIHGPGEFTGWPCLDKRTIQARPCHLR
jgi:CRP-like cAMP-binding protein